MSFMIAIFMHVMRGLYNRTNISAVQSNKREIIHSRVPGISDFYVLHRALFRFSGLVWAFYRLSARTFFCLRMMLDANNDLGISAVEHSLVAFIECLPFYAKSLYNCFCWEQVCESCNC